VLGRWAVRARAAGFRWGGGGLSRHDEASGQQTADGEDSEGSGKGLDRRRDGSGAAGSICASESVLTDLPTEENLNGIKPKPIRPDKTAMEGLRLRIARTFMRAKLSGGRVGCFRVAPYSLRRARMGSTDAARRAGRSPLSSAYATPRAPH